MIKYNMYISKITLYNIRVNVMYQFRIQFLNQLSHNNSICNSVVDCRFHVIDYVVQIYLFQFFSIKVRQLTAISWQSITNVNFQISLNSCFNAEIKQDNERMIHDHLYWFSQPFGLHPVPIQQPVESDSTKSNFLFFTIPFVQATKNSIIQTYTRTNSIPQNPLVNLSSCFLQEISLT